MYDEALRDLRNLHRGGVSTTGWAGTVRKEDVVRWSEVSGLGLTETFDNIGIEMALDFALGILTWQFCDMTANALFGVLVEMANDGVADFDEPKHFWEFYLAFDHSETVPAAEAHKVAHDQIERFLASIPVLPNVRFRPGAE